MIDEARPVVAWVDAADLPAEARAALLAHLKQLPGLAHEFSQTYESRYLEQILRAEQGMYYRLVAEKAVALMAPLVEHLQGLHGRLGLPALDATQLHPTLKPTPRKKRKAG